MTKHRRRKQDTRKRMAATGTRYMQAQREDAQERSDENRVSNPILHEWGLALRKGHLTFEQLLKGWTLDGASVSPHIQGETYLEMIALEVLATTSPQLLTKRFIPADWESSMLASWEQGRASNMLRYRFSPTPVTLALAYGDTPLGREALLFATRELPERAPAFMDAPVAWPEQRFDEELDQAVRMGLISSELSVAIRKLRLTFKGGPLQEEAAASTVWELSEDGDKWFIEGAKTLAEAHILLYSWLVETDRRPAPVQKDERLLAGITFTPRSDWFWRPLAEEEPEGEAELLCLEKAPEHHAGEPLLTGFFAQEE